MGETNLEDTNLALIGSDLDKAAREAAAKLEINWEGAGQKPGIEIWRVENKRTESNTPDFGINVWPKEMYGEFFEGDSYIVLKTTKDPSSERLMWDIHFWIGKESSQDEYGVAAYKANELDDLFGDVPVQHREVQGIESEDFLNCFPQGIKYLAGGIESGFRLVGDSATPEVTMPTRLFHVRKAANSKIAKCFLVPPTGKSLNKGDAFLLDNGNELYTWYGEDCSPFEKQKAKDVATRLAEGRVGMNCKVITDVGSSDGDLTTFWELLGGETEIKAAEEVSDAVIPEEHACKMYKLAEDDSDGRIVITAINPPDKSGLDTTAVALLDIGPEIMVWMGAKASKREQSQAMTMVGEYLKTWGREKNTRVSRVREGQESRCKSWKKAFN